jgi:integration host factor subunit alpha
VPITKSHLIDTIVEQNGFSKKKIHRAAEILHETIKLALASGEDFLISGFGKFCVKAKREHL